ncbi:toluene tolerance protein, partial [Azotobacter chroococcum]|nr:toluene tolerance protein [Azotobacter chroococcum]
MRIVSAQELEKWLESGRVLEKDARGPKVVALDDGRFLKIFHTRRHPL